MHHSLIALNFNIIFFLLIHLRFLRPKATRPRDEGVWQSIYVFAQPAWGTTLALITLWSPCKCGSMYPVAADNTLIPALSWVFAWQVSSLDSLLFELLHCPGLCLLPAFLFAFCIFPSLVARVFASFVERRVGFARAARYLGSCVWFYFSKEALLETWFAGQANMWKRSYKLVSSTLSTANINSLDKIC